jgi:type II secretory pathway pseudopilin PulG
MNKEGIALIFSLIVVLVLSILLSALYFKSISENNLVDRYLSSMRAFWVAEAGIAEAKRNLPGSPTNGNLGDYSYETTTTYRTTINNSNYYDISSTGIVPSLGGNISRTVNAVVKTGPIDPTKFQYSIQAANDLCFGGGCDKDPYKYIHPATGMIATRNSTAQLISQICLPASWMS